jgi:serine/threonine protein kinase
MKGDSHDEKVDVWSFGMVLYEITTNKIPYDYCKNNAQIIFRVTVEKKIPNLPEETKIHPILLDVMKQCWNQDPSQRPSFSQIVQMLRNEVAK